MQYNAADEKIIVVVTNYLYNSTIEFENDSKIYFKEFNLSKVSPSIQFSNVPVPMQILEQIQGSLPIVTYESVDKSFKLTYSDVDKTISFEIVKSEKYLISMLKSAIDKFIDAKVSDVKAMGFNFVSQYNLANKKLKLLNTNIETFIPNFKNNRAFQVTLLLQLADCVATYKIRKTSGGDDTGEDRIYQIDSNFHFDFSTARTKDKIDKIAEYVQNLDIVYLNEYKKECNNILAMSNDV